MIYSNSNGNTEIKLNTFSATNLLAQTGYGGGIAHLGSGIGPYLKVETTSGTINPSTSQKDGGFIYAN